MNESITPLQREAFEAKEDLCKSIGDHGCGRCPLDELRREKNVTCDLLCLTWPDEVQQKLRNRVKEKAALRGEAINTDWEATAKRLQKANKQLTVELNAELERSAKLEKDLREAREEAAKKNELKERVAGQRDAYLNVLSMMLGKEE